METLDLAIVKRASVEVWPAGALTLSNEFGSGAEFLFYDTARYETAPTTPYITNFTYTLASGATAILSFQTSSGVTFVHEPASRTFSLSVTNSTNPTLKLICAVNQTVTTTISSLYKDGSSGGTFGYVYITIASGSTFTYATSSISHTISFSANFTITDFSGTYGQGWTGGDIYVNSSYVTGTQNSQGNVITFSIPAINPASPTVPIVEVRARNGGWTWTPTVIPPESTWYTVILNFAYAYKLKKNGDSYDNSFWPTGGYTCTVRHVTGNGKVLYKVIGTNLGILESEAASITSFAGSYQDSWPDD